MPSTLAALLRGVVAAVRSGVATPAVLRQAVSVLSDAAVVADDGGRLVITNAAASTLTGYSPEELLKLYVPDITGAGDREHFELLWQAFIRIGHQRGQYELHRKSGRPVPVEYAAASNVVPGLHLSLLRPAAAPRSTSRSTSRSTRRSVRRPR